MGILDIFKKKPKEQEKAPEVEQKNSVNMPIFTTLSDGRLNAEFYNGITTEREFYDTTKLTIDTQNTFLLAGKTIYNCVVAWDGQNDCRIFNDRSEEQEKIIGNRGDYKGVWMEIDPWKLQTDPEYCEALMNKLLLKSRVSSLIEEGLKETPNRPCGKYIGGVRKEEGQYKKYFDSMAGIEAHKSPFMVDRRAKLRVQEQERKAKQSKQIKQK